MAEPLAGERAESGSDRQGPAGKEKLGAEPARGQAQGSVCQGLGGHIGVAMAT